MIGGRHIRHTVAAKEQRVLPLTRQGTDETLRNGIVDAVTAIFQISEYLIPEVLQIIDRLFHQISTGRMTLRSQHIQETAHAANDILCPQGIPLPGYLFGSQTGLTITVFLAIQPAYVFQHLFRIHVTALLVCIHELGTSMSQATQVFRVVQPVFQIHVYIVTVRLQRPDLPVAQNVLQGITAAGTFLITIDDNLLFAVDQTPDISFAITVLYLHLAPGLVAVHDGIFLHGHILERFNQSLGKPCTFLKPVGQGHAAQKHTMVIQTVHLTVIRHIQHKVVKGQMGQEIGRCVGSGNYIDLIGTTGFREITFQNPTVRPLVTDYLVLMFQYIANLLIGVLVEGLDDYGIFRNTAQV